MQVIEPLLTGRGAAALLLFSVRQRLRAASLFALKHLSISALIALSCAALVFGLWYPHPFGELASGRELFALVVSVDVVMGPLLSLFVYDPRKARRELVRDIGTIVVLQVAALGYGLYSVTQARPVWLAFEGDRFRVVAVPDIDLSSLPQAQPGLDRLSWTGPRKIGVRLLDPSDPEYLQSIQLALQGLHPAFRPQRWVPFDLQREQVIRQALPLDRLNLAGQTQRALLERSVRDSGLREAELGYLPLFSAHRSDWIVVVSRRDGEPVAYLPIDGF